MNAPPLSSDAVDKQATLVALAAVAGETTPADAGWSLVCLMIMSGIPEAVAVRKVREDRQAALDTGLGLAELVERKIRGELPNGVDLNRIAAGESFSGWVRQFCRTAWRSVLRDVLARRVAVKDWATESAEFVELDPGRDAAMMRSVDAAAEFEDRMFANRHRRAESLPFERARAICDGVGLPTPQRLPGGGDRRRVSEALDADPNFGFGEVAAMLCGSATNPALSAAFSGYTEGDLEALLGLGRRAVRTLLESAVCDRPPVAKAARRDLQRRVRVASGLDGWVWLAGRLTAAFLATESDLIPDGRRWSTKPAVLKAKERRTLEGLVAKALVVLGSEGPEDTEALISWLRSELAEAVDEHAAAVSGTQLRAV